jgi:hypothetical protein
MLMVMLVFELSAIKSFQYIDSGCPKGNHYARLTRHLPLADLLNDPQVDDLLARVLNCLVPLILDNMLSESFDITQIPHERLDLFKSLILWEPLHRILSIMVWLLIWRIQRQSTQRILVRRLCGQLRNDGMIKTLGGSKIALNQLTGFCLPNLKVSTSTKLHD